VWNERPTSESKSGVSYTSDCSVVSSFAASNDFSSSYIRRAAYTVLGRRHTPATRRSHDVLAEWMWMRSYTKCVLMCARIYTGCKRDYILDLTFLRAEQHDEMARACPLERR